MEELGGLSHLYLTLYLHSFAVIMVAPAITDITMSALCPGEDECSLAIYLSGFQQAVCFLPRFPIILIRIMQLHYLVSPSSLLPPPFRNSVYVPLNLATEGGVHYKHNFSFNFSFLLSDFFGFSVIFNSRFLTRLRNEVLMCTRGHIL